MEQLHPGAKWLFRVRVYTTFIFLSSWFGGFFIFGLISGTNFFLPAILVYLFSFVFVLLLIGEFYTNLAYKNWKFELAQNELKIEKGIIWKKYSAIPYERIQNIEIRRGILARIIGFSTLDVQTAGSHYTGNNTGAMSEGHIPAIAVKKAEDIREFLMKKISRKGI